MDNILIQVGKSYGGIVCNQIEVIESNSTTNSPNFYNHYWVEEFASDEDWKRVIARKRTAHFSENQQIIDGGQFYKSQIKINWQKDDTVLLTKLVSMSRQGLLIRWRDMNGNIKLMGSPDAPARFTFGRDNKPTMPEVNILEGYFFLVSRFPVFGYPVVASPL